MASDPRTLEPLSDEELLALLDRALADGDTELVRSIADEIERRGLEI